MARLLVKNNRLAVRNGRLVTTAGGAPCCCDPTGVCACEIPIQFRSASATSYDPCQENFQPVEELLPGVWRDADDVRIQYNGVYKIEYELFRLGLGQFPRTRFVFEKTITFSLLECIAFDVRTGLGFFEAQAGLRFQSAGTDVDSVEFEDLYTGNEAMREWGWQQGPTGIQAHPWGEGRLGLKTLTLPITNMRRIVPQDAPIAPAFLWFRCNEDFIDNEGPYRTEARYQYFDTPSRGEGSIYNKTEQDLFAQRGTVFDGRITIVQTVQASVVRTYRNCGGGGGGDVPARPGNCAGCGDPSRLTIV
jgi:hypothetical protein